MAFQDINKILRGNFCRNIVLTITLKTSLLLFAIMSLCMLILLIFDFVILVENVHVAIPYDCLLDVLHATVTHFDFISVEYLVKCVCVVRVCFV